MIKDAAEINRRLPAEKIIQLPVGDVTVDQTIEIPSGTILRGSGFGTRLVIAESLKKEAIIIPCRYRGCLREPPQDRASGYSEGGQYWNRGGGRAQPAGENMDRKHHGWRGGWVGSSRPAAGFAESIHQQADHSANRAI